MKLIRFNNGRTGLIVDRLDGPYVIDVVGSIGALAPDDPITQGMLNGALKDNRSWAHVIEHWSYVRRGLGKLARLAMTQEARGLAMQPLCEVRLDHASGDPNSIATLVIAEHREVAVDPTGRELMTEQAAQ